MLNRMIRLMFAACALMLFAAPAGDAMAQAYELKPGDIVEITVLEDPSLNRRVLIGPDGAVSLPLAGSVQAGGRTLNALQSGIASRLRGQFVNPPSVTVSLVALGPEDLDADGDGDGEVEAPAEDEPELASFYVLGEVARPGRYDYEVDSPINVLQALAIAGGPGVFAARSRIQVRSRVPDPNAPAPAETDTNENADADAAETDGAKKDDKAASEVDDAPPPAPIVTLEELRLFDYEAVENGDPESALMYVRDGDVIVVPERGLFE